MSESPKNLPVKTTVTLLLNVQNKDVPVVITDLANFRLELTERVDFGSAQDVVKWLDQTYGSGAGGTKIELPPKTDVPPPLRTLYMVFTNAHVWLDALMVDRKTTAFKFGVSIDFTQTPVDATQLTEANKTLDTEVDAQAAKTGKKGTELENVKTELKGGAKAVAEAKEAEEKITKAATTGGWDIFNGIKIKGIGVMFERPPKAETTQPTPTV